MTYDVAVGFNVDTDDGSERFEPGDTVTAARLDKLGADVKWLKGRKAIVVQKKGKK